MIARQTAAVDVPTIPATAQLSKKQLSFILRPDGAKYNYRVVEQFFSPERMHRCGVQPDNFKKIRVFSIEQTAAIKRELVALYSVG